MGLWCDRDGDSEGEDTSGRRSGLGGLRRGRAGQGQGEPKALKGFEVGNLLTRGTRKSKSLGSQIGEPWIGGKYQSHSRFTVDSENICLTPVLSIDFYYLLSREQYIFFVRVSDYCEWGWNSARSPEPIVFALLVLQWSRSFSTSTKQEYNTNSLASSEDVRFELG